jgi:hypothetical protein
MAATSYNSHGFPSSWASACVLPGPLPPTTQYCKCTYSAQGEVKCPSGQQQPQQQPPQQQQQQQQQLSLFEKFNGGGGSSYSQRQLLWNTLRRPS